MIVTVTSTALVNLELGLLLQLIVLSITPGVCVWSSWPISAVTTLIFVICLLLLPFHYKSSISVNFSLIQGSITLIMR